MLKLSSLILSLAVVGCLKSRSVRGSNVDVFATASKLDYGLRFYGRNLKFRKVQPGVPNPFYDPKKATLLISNGYHRENYKKIGEEFFTEYKDPATNQRIDIITPLIDLGYNVIFFDWRVFCDEDLVNIAENKVWETDSKGEIRYRTEDGKYSTEGSPNLPIADLLVRDYLAVMKDYAGDNVRFLAMSLGSQVVARAAQILQKKGDEGSIPSNVIPKRVALLDPYATNKPLGGVWRGGAVRDIVSSLRKKNIVFELTKTSNFLAGGLVGDTNIELAQNIGRMEYNFGFLDSGNPVADLPVKHKASEMQYLMSFTQPVPTACMNGICTKLTSGSASDEEAREFMDAARSYKQERPMGSPTDQVNFVLDPSIVPQPPGNAGQLPSADEADRPDASEGGETGVSAADSQEPGRDAKRVGGVR